MLNERLVDNLKKEATMYQELFGNYFIIAQAIILQSITVEEWWGGGRNDWDLNSSEVLALAEADHQARENDLDF